MKMATCWACFRRRPKKKLRMSHSTGYNCPGDNCSQVRSASWLRRNLSMRPQRFSPYWRPENRRALGAPKWRGVYR